MKILTMKTVLDYIDRQGIANVNLKVEIGGVTVYTSAQVYNEFRFNYWCYKIPLSDLYTSNAGYFLELWQEYVNNTKAQLSRSLAALAAEYDPVSNYDMKEQSADGTKLSKETDKVTPKGGTKTTVNRFGIDSDANGEPYDVTQIEPLEDTQTETTKEYTSDNTIPDNDGNTVSGFHEAKQHFLQRSGNIGVTTAQQMITEELKLRQVDLLRVYVKAFIDRYAYTTGGD